MSTFTPIWKDVVFETTGDTKVDSTYYIVDAYRYNPGSAQWVEIQTISGTTRAMPGETQYKLCLNNMVEEYLKPDFENNRWIDYGPNVISGIEINPYGVVRCRANVSGQTSTVYFIYNWTYDVSDVGSSAVVMSEPINGHMDPRMKLMHTYGAFQSTRVDYSIESDS